MMNKRLIKFVVVFVLLLISLLLLIAKPQDIDQPPEEGTNTDYSVAARIVDGENLFYQLGGGSRFDSLAKDLYTYAKSNYENYKNNPDKVVGFKVEEITENDLDITIYGRYGSSKNRIQIQIKLLNNNRQHVSVVDTVTKINIDEQLASNNSRNEYIATLPKTENGYSVEYVEKTDSVVINLYDRDPALAEQAYKDLLNIVGAEYSEGQLLIVNFPPPSFGEDF